MRFDSFLLALTVLGSAAASVIDSSNLQPRAEIEIETRDESHELGKRRGGGGGGGRGGGGGHSSGGSGSSGSGSSGSGGSRSGSGSSSGSGGSRSGSGSSSGSGGTHGSVPSNGKTGSASRGSPYKGYSGYSGHGPPPSYAGGRYYAGGSSVPYQSGRVSPAAGIAPYLLIGGGAAYGVHHSAYMYNYNHTFTFFNSSAHKKETLPVTCACDQYSDCDCDEQTNTDTLKQLVGNGDYAKLNKSVIDVRSINHTRTLVLNGTLPNGTSVDDTGAGSGLRSSLQALGYWPAAVAVLAAVFLG